MGHPNFTNKCDIWQFGCIIYELATLQKAFREDYHVYLLSRSQLSLEIPLISSSVSTQRHFSDLIKSLLQISPSDRPSASSLSSELTRLMDAIPLVPELLFIIPYERNPSFVGSDCVENINRHLGDPETVPSHRVVLFGMGGIGKTQTAIEFVYRYRDNYRQAFWVSAITQHQETWHSNNQTNRDGIVMSSDYSGLTRLTDYSVPIV
jgi:serine/threonine protein kinase